MSLPPTNLGKPLDELSDMGMSHGACTWRARATWLLRRIQ